MRVLHFQHMGVGVVLSNEMNKRPWMKSRVLEIGKHPFGFRGDYRIPERLRGFGSQRVAYWLLSILSNRFDILHSHDGIPLPDYVLRRWQGRFIQHYHNPLADQFYDTPCFVATPAMTERVTQGEWLPLPVDMTMFYPHKQAHDKIRMGYSYNPTADQNKLKWIPHKELQEIKTDKIELAPLTKSIPYSLMPRYYQSLDIYVDRIGLGFYGWQAAEAAACGVAVLSQFGWRQVNCPFLCVSRENVAETVFELARSPKWLNDLKNYCEAYSLSTHESSKVANQCIERYRDLLGEP